MIIGITGSFGSGKSTVAKILKRVSKGCLLDADRIARNLVQGKLKKNVIEEFGTVNRKKLAELVFSDKRKLDKLNKIVHPDVKKEINRQIKKCKNQVIIIDAPLLIEAGIKTDFVIVVKTIKRKQIRRLNGKFSRVEFLERVRHQISITKKIEHADFVVDNNGSMKNTGDQVKKIWEKIRIR